MSFFQRNSNDDRAKVDAIMRSQAVIEFNLDGTILDANENFLKALGYELKEIVGKHHRMFVDPADANSTEYKQFWSDLAAGKFQSAVYRRIAKGGREIWIQATYNPVFDRAGKPVKVIKFATDITAQ
jgi:methyl-accepting chemotaxis protein